MTACLLLLAGCVAADEPSGDATPSPNDPPPSGGAAPPPLAFESSAFTHMGAIPQKYTCDGDNVNPPINITGAPHAGSFALIMEDPDAPSGTINHWTFWNLAPGNGVLAEAQDMAALNATEGNDYGGPCPPVTEHRYFFYTYAVNGTLDLAAGASVDELRAALEGRILDQTEVYGTYQRPVTPPV